MTFSHLPHFNSSRTHVQFSRCPACDEYWDDADDHDVVTDRYGFKWTLATCASCDVQWQKDPLTDDARQWFYRSGEYRRLCEQVTGKPWTDGQYLQAEQRKYANRWIERAWTNLPDGRWLDYGGSTGIVSMTAANHSIGTCTERIVADYGDGATVTPEQALEMGKVQPYDAVICAQTLDHLDCPLETLRTFRDISRDGATLFVDVVKKSQTQYKVDHSNYWPSAGCFISCVERAGWTVEWLDGTTDPAHWAIGARKA